jgi:ATP-dependent DNA helicase PIF1
MTTITKTNNQEITLSQEQKYVFQKMEESREHLFITGRAGAGKSVLLRHFRENTKKRVVVAAPTGIAALNVKGSTLHSLFHLPFGLYQKGKLDEDPKLSSVLKRIDTLIIDEISMVRADTLDAVDERLREARESDEVFGGVQLVMFGDVFQLPPVVGKSLAETKHFETYYNSAYFFDAHVWKHVGFKVFQLEQVFRQKDPDFKEALNAIREGSHTNEHIAKLNARYGAAIPKEGTITLAPTNKLVSQINQQQLNRLPGEMKEYYATITGNIKENSFPTEELLQLKKDAQVVFLHNDKDKRYINGTVGIIDELYDDHIDVKIGEKKHTVDRYTWEEITYTYNAKTKEIEERVTSSFTQYPVRLAWALTMHKSQGQTYESVAIDLTTPTFAHGQCYVALSRATSLEGLYLKRPIEKKHIIVDPKIKLFMSRVETITVEESVQIAVVEAPQIIVEETPVSTAKRGRKAKIEGEKVVKTDVRFDPSIRAALDALMEELKEANEETIAALVPESAHKKPSLSDVLTAALLQYEPFQEKFYGKYEDEFYARKDKKAHADKSDDAGE